MKAFSFTRSHVGMWMLLSLMGQMGCNSVEKKPDPAPATASTSETPSVKSEEVSTQSEAEFSTERGAELGTENKAELSTQKEATSSEDGRPAEEESAKSVVVKIDESLNKDGIDDENPLPKTGPLRTQFDDAVELAILDPKNAVAQFEAVAKENKYFYAAWFNAAVSAERAKDDVKAENLYKKTLIIRPDYGPALVNLYNLYFRQGKGAEADQVVDKALQANARRAGPHLAAANRAYRKKDVEETQKEALAAIRISERTVEAMRLMGWVFAQQKRFETAKFALANALILEPGNALLLFDIGYVYLQLEDEKAAMNAFGKAALMRPEMAEAHERYGILLTRFGDGLGAYNAFKKVAELQPKSAIAQLHLGNGLRLIKKYEDAEAAYKKALELNSNLQFAHLNLALMYMDNKIGDRDKLLQMEQAQSEFEIYLERGVLKEEQEARIQGYLKTLKRRIKREKKRRKRKAARKAVAEEEEKKAAADKAAADKAAADKAAADKAAADKAAADKAASTDGEIK